MNEWMNVYLYTAHITYCLKAVYNSNWVRSKAPQAAAISSYLISLTHPTFPTRAWNVQGPNLPNPCMNCTRKLPHHTGNYVAYSFRQFPNNSLISLVSRPVSVFLNSFTIYGLQNLPFIAFSNYLIQPTTLQVWSWYRPARHLNLPINVIPEGGGGTTG